MNKKKEYRTTPIAIFMRRCGFEVKMRSCVEFYGVSTLEQVSHQPSVNYTYDEI